MFQEWRFPQPSEIITLISLSLSAPLCALGDWLAFMDSWVPWTSGCQRREEAWGGTWQEIRRHGLCLCTSLHSLLATPFHRGSCHQDLVTRTWPSDQGMGMTFCSCHSILGWLPYSMPKQRASVWRVQPCEGNSGNVNRVFCSLLVPQPLKFISSTSVPN